MTPNRLVFSSSLRTNLTPIKEDIRVTLTPTLVERLREMNSYQDELVLRVEGTQIRKGESSPHSITLGVFHGVDEEEPYAMMISNCFRFFASEKFGGLNIPLISRVEETHYRLSPHLKFLHLGQEKIVETLKSWKGYQAHADWVSKLRKPYIEEQK